MEQPSNQNEKTHLTIEPKTQNMQKIIKMKSELKTQRVGNMDLSGQDMVQFIAFFKQPIARIHKT